MRGAHVIHAPRLGRLAALALVALFCPPARAKADDLNNSLFAAIRNGDVNAVQQLIERGANVNARDQNDETPLMQAALNSNTAVMTRLLQARAEVNART